MALTSICDGHFMYLVSAEWQISLAAFDIDRRMSCMLKLHVTESTLRLLLHVRVSYGCCSSLSSLLLGVLMFLVFSHAGLDCFEIHIIHANCKYELFRLGARYVSQYANLLCRYCIQGQ